VIGGRLDDLAGRLSIFGVGRLFLITDRRVHELYGAKLLRDLSGAGWRTAAAVLPPGERTKSLYRLERLYAAGVEAGLERLSLVLALGGGVVTDLAGFFAATFLRGLPLVNVPTTLLGQVDAAIGGKNGLNLPAGKNLAGTFYQPRLVYCDLDTLATLPFRDYRSGLAEIIKCGVIRDPDLFDLMERGIDGFKRRDPYLLRRAVTAAVRVKRALVEADPLERTGLRRELNFGHTVGHGLEKAGGYRRFRHGEAVALGMLAEAELARRRGLLASAAADRLGRLVAAYGFRTRAAGCPLEGVLSALLHDKKKQDGRVKFVLPAAIGRTVTCDDVAQAELAAVLKIFIN